jgi:hypothetical protein
MSDDLHEIRLMKNTAPTKRDLLNALTETVCSRLPRSWRFDLSREIATQYQADAVAQIRTPDGRTGLLLIEVKNHLYPKDVLALVPELRGRAEGMGSGAFLVVAPFISPRARELLKEAQAGYADPTGNVHIELESPAALIDLSGASANPWPEDKSLRSLRGPSAGRAVRAFCDFLPPFGIEEISQRSQTSIASISRAAALLDRESVMMRDSRGRVLSVDWPKAIERWTLDYSLMRSSRAAMYLEPRAFSGFLDKLTRTQFRYAVTASLAASRIAPVAAARLAVVYVDDPNGAAKDLRISPVDEAGNVLLVEPFDPVVFDRTWTRDGVTYAALTQVAADLLTSPGRGPSEGRALIDWMIEHEREWRA